MDAPERAAMGGERRFDRQTAVKTWIRNLANGKYVANPGWEPNHVLAGGVKIGRANVIGAVVQRSDSKVLSYDYLMLDDGTGRIMVRAFEGQPLAGFQVGDLVNIVGKPREYADEIYLIPEVARRLEDPLWAEVRRRELAGQPLLEAKESLAAIQAPAEETVEAEEIVTPLDRLLDAIRGLDKGDGVEVEDIASAVKGQDAEKLLQSLLMRGDIFEIRPGRVKVLE
jgi:RPA family protein